MFLSTTTNCSFLSSNTNLTKGLGQNWKMYHSSHCIKPPQFSSCSVFYYFDWSENKTKWHENEIRIVLVVSDVNIIYSLEQYSGIGRNKQLNIQSITLQAMLLFISTKRMSENSAEINNEPNTTSKSFPANRTKF